MTDRPIIFSGPMVRALLDGRKTQTRRLLSIKGHKGFFQFQPSDTNGYDWTFRRADHVWEDYSHEMLLSKLPIATGDRLYVREAVTRQETDQGVGFQTYAADGAEVWPLTKWYHQRKSIPSIHMPRWASRLTLTVTDVRVQRLQDISEADAVAEGIEATTPTRIVQPYYKDYEGTLARGFVSARRSFQSLWNSLHGPDAWAENPWVAAYTFTVQRGNIDEVKV